MKVHNKLAIQPWRRYKYERLQATYEKSTELPLRRRNLLLPLVGMALSLAALAAFFVSG